ncbi:MAG TPA: hypothetical protein VEZ11_07285 [Thermoanaerobaculia bacterium]|nr:hypothetical protein [Thermoanaerobaculia bacterium]
MSLIAAELERHGIATVSIILLREVAERVRPPRALSVPFRHGYPLGAPHDPDQQRTIMRTALALLERRDLAPPVLVDYA